jgi:replicative DNA helicase
MENKTLEEINNLLNEIEEKKKDRPAKEKLASFEMALRDYRGEDQVISFQDYWDILKKDKPEVYSFPVGISGLDKMTDGFQEGELVIISGPTGQGKTSLLQTFTKNIAEKGVRSLWFSFEVQARQFLEKFGEPLPIGFIPQSVPTRQLVWIERKIIEAIVKYGVKAVFIDHLHYIIDSVKMKNISLEVGNVVRDIKRMALRYNITIFLASHLAKTGFEDRIGLEDIRDSSFIAQEADFVGILWRLTDKNQKKWEAREQGTIYLDESVLSLQKNRRSGKQGSVRLKMRDNFFYETDLDHIEPEENILL